MSSGIPLKVILPPSSAISNLNSSFGGPSACFSKKWVLSTYSTRYPLRLISVDSTTFYASGYLSSSYDIRPTSGLLGIYVPSTIFRSSSSSLRIAQIESHPSICPDFLSIPTWDCCSIPVPPKAASSSSSNAMSLRLAADNIHKLHIIIPWAFGSGAQLAQIRFVQFYFPHVNGASRCLPFSQGSLRFLYCC